MPPHERPGLDVPPLAITVTYNERTDRTEAQAERLSRDYVEDVRDALVRLGHDARLMEVSREPAAIVRRLDSSAPDLVFNLAEGERGVWREALYPMIFEYLRIPYTGAGPGTLALGLDKRLTEEVLAVRGVKVPRGRLVTRDDPKALEGLRFPLLIKPNFEGSSMGIHQDSIVEDEAEAMTLLGRLLSEYPDGLDVEEFVQGRELTVGFLAAKEDPFTEIVEYRFDEGRHNIMDYETKQNGGVRTLCPAPLPRETQARVRDIAARAVSAMSLPDFGRVDLRLRDDGEPVLLEVNPLAGLRRVSPLVVGARQQGHSYEDIIGFIVASAARRYGLLGAARQSRERKQDGARQHERERAAP